MEVVGRQAAACLVLCFGAISADAKPVLVNEFIQCSALFQARANWVDTLDASIAEKHMMQNYAKTVLEEADKLYPATDWRMRSGFASEDQMPNYSSLRDKEALSLMTKFAENGYAETGLPLCLKDADCNKCTEVLRKIVQ